MTPSMLRSASGALLAGAVTFAVPAAGQVAIKRAPSGFNLFTVEQDLEIGTAAAAEIERRVRLVTSARTTGFLNEVSGLLAAKAPGAYPFQVRAINSAGVNALVLPGGQVFLTRGLLSLTRNEAEVAGLVAHAMAHVILRHGTERVSKAYLSKAGLGALGGLAGSAGMTHRIVSAVGGFGLNGAFLAFTRSDEYEADALGAELLSRAGYDPVAVATLLATLRREKGRLPGIDRLFDNHPAAADREIRVRNLSNVLRQGRSEVVGGFSRMRWRGGTATSVATAAVNASNGSIEIRNTPVPPDIPPPPPPSSRFTLFSAPEARIVIEHPDNWDAYQSGGAMSFAPAGGVVATGDGAPSLRQGVVINEYAPFEDDVERWNNSLTRHYAPFHDRSRPRGTLEDATDDLVRQILSITSYLNAPTGSARPETVDGVRGYSVRLSGRSPLTGQMERVTLYTRMLADDHVVYLACVAQGRSALLMERTCARMVHSMRLNEAAANRQ